MIGARYHVNTQEFDQVSNVLSFKDLDELKRADLI